MVLRHHPLPPDPVKDVDGRRFRADSPAVDIAQKVALPWVLRPRPRKQERSVDRSTGWPPMLDDRAFGLSFAVELNAQIKLASQLIYPRSDFIEEFSPARPVRVVSGRRP